MTTNIFSIEDSMRIQLDGENKNIKSNDNFQDGKYKLLNEKDNIKIYEYNYLMDHARDCSHIDSLELGTMYDKVILKNKYIIFIPSERLGNALFRYFACALISIKFNLIYTLEKNYNKNNNYNYYKGVDYPFNDIKHVQLHNLNELIRVCNSNKDYVGINTLGYIKSNIDIKKLVSTEYINNENNHGIYVKDYIEVNDDNFLNCYKNIDIIDKNIYMNGLFHNNVYIKNKDIILKFIEKNKDKHYIQTDRNDLYLLKDIYDDIKLDNSQIYDLVIHLRLSDFINHDWFIEFIYYEELFKTINFNSNKNAIVIEYPNNEKDKIYLNKCINWFQNNNININIESNDLITDFNIMKQCNTLICSTSTLSHTAAFLSKNIKLCYIPIDYSKSKNESENNINIFCPIENTIFYNYKKNINCYICGCVLNCGKYLNNVFNNIFKIGILFNKYKIVIAYDQSNDESLNILLDYQKNYRNIEIIINKNEKSVYKTENIKNARNSILNFIKNDVDKELYDFFIMMDFDDVCEKSININVLEKHLHNNNEWDSLSFNRYNYYDIWALSIEPYVTSCWHWSIKQNDSLYVKNIMENYIKNKLKSINENELLECYSAFNGFAIYRKDKFINCVYNNNIFNSLGKIPINLIQNNIDKLNDISSKNNSMYISLLEDCEHRSFHLDAMFNYGARNRISPLYLFDDSSEVDCKYVSSRGILKSCTIKSATPISSINQLINYDFTELTELTDGISIYVCNYALGHFIEIFDQIKCKIILVSGDSDCLIPYEIFKNHESFLSFIESEKIIHWYTQNCVIDHPKISKIPIGMDYHTMSDKDSDWGKKISPIKQENILENIKNNSLPFYERKIKCYANFHFSIETKYGFDRKDALQNIDKNLVFYENQKIDRENTWKKQVDYAFVISPHGNGLDCHRTWEALILGCIPIMKRSGLFKLFDDLPVLIVENWCDINNELLINTVNNFKNKIFNYHKLLLNYWTNKINNKINIIHNIIDEYLFKPNKVIEPNSYKIIGITVSTNYDDILNIIIHQNYKFLDKWYIITHLNDIKTINIINETGYKNIEILYFDFYNNSIFNKGGAIKYCQNIINNLNYNGNILLLDSDIFLPNNFNEIINNIKIENNILYGPDIRNDYYSFKNFTENIIDKKNIENNSKWISGYFQLYKFSSEYLYENSNNCSECDIIFSNKFNKKIFINKLEVFHFGKANINWNGRLNKDDFLNENKNNISIKNLKIYVTHYTPLIERKTHIINQLNKYKYKYNFIEKYKKEE
jgi:hypothetical protein